MASSYESPAAFHIRPIQAADLWTLKTFLCELSPGTLYFRFGRLSVPMWTEQEWIRLCSPDAERFAHFVATAPSESGRYAIVGMGRLVCEVDNGHSAEFSIVVADHLQHQGLGTKLIHALVGEARRRALRSMYGDVLPSNQAMIRFCKGLGFVSHRCPDDERIHRMVLSIKSKQSEKSVADTTKPLKHLAARYVS